MKVRTKDRSGILENIAQYLLYAIIFFVPFFRGLFFDNDFNVAALFLAALLFILGYELFKGSRKVLVKPVVVVIAFLYVLSYVITVFTAANVDGAVLEMHRMLTYFAIVILVVNYVNTDKKEEHLLKVIYFSGVGVALIGILAACSFNIYPDAFKEQRIYSTLQYPNTTAVLLNVVFLIGIYLSHKDVRLSKYFDITNYLVLTAFFGTLSRGGLLVYLVTFLILLISKIPGSKTSFIVKALVLNVFAVVSSILIIKYTSLNKASIFIPALISAVIYYLMPKLTLEKISLKRAIPFIIALLGVGVLILKNFAPRILDMNFSNADSLRFYYYKDALKIIKDHWLLGVGGDGWSAVYSQYRGHLYYTSEVHNHYLQTWIEGGILALLSFLSLILLSIRNLTTSLRSEINFKLTIIGIAIIALAMHAAVDFSFSIGAVFILFWILLILQLKDNSFQLDKLRLGKLSGGLIIVLAFVISLHSAAYLAAADYNHKAAVLAQSGSANQALPLLEKAIKIYPFDQRYKFNIAKVLFTSGKAQNKIQEINKAEAIINQALKYSPYNWDLLELQSRIYFEQGRINEAVAIKEKVVRLNPMVVKNYEALIDAYNKGARSYAIQGNKAEAIKLLNKVDEVPARLRQVRDNIEPERMTAWGGDALEVTNTMKIYTSEKELLLGNYSTALNYLSQVTLPTDKELKFRYFMYGSIVKMLMGDYTATNVILEQAKAIDTSAEQQFQSYLELLKLLK